MPRLKLIEMDSLNKMIYFRKDDKLIAFDADVAIELISDSLDGKYAPVRHGRWIYLYDGNYKCSECGSWWTCEETPIESGMLFCPNCGAEMDEPIDTPTDT